MKRLLADSGTDMSSALNISPFLVQNCQRTTADDEGSKMKIDVKWSIMFQPLSLFLALRCTSTVREEPNLHLLRRLGEDLRAS